MSNDPYNILMAAGGTGGHIFPALAVADALRELDPRAQISFVGTSYGLEGRLVPAHGYPIDMIHVRYLKGVKLWKLPQRVLGLSRSAWESWRLLRRLKPAMVIGAGGYVSGPVTGIASLCRIPTAIMEQNAIPGLTNRLLMPFVKRVFTSFEDSPYAYPQEKLRYYGNPIRSMEVETPDAPREDGKLHVLVFGGSQGAQSLNEHVPRVLAELSGAKDIFVRHQCGRNREEDTRARYEGFGGRADVVEFIEGMPGAYRWADLVICRSGATTVAELKAAGKPSLLVPFPRAAHNHQEKNAQALVDVGAARIVLDADLAGTTLREQIEGLLSDPTALQEMRDAALAHAQPDAARDVAMECLRMIRRAPSPALGTGMPRVEAL